MIKISIRNNDEHVEQPAAVKTSSLVPVMTMIFRKIRIKLKHSSNSILQTNPLIHLVFELKYSVKIVQELKNKKKLTSIEFLRTQIHH